MMRFNEPECLVEPEEKMHGRRLYETVFALILTMVIGVIVSVKLASLPPTFNGNVDVSAIQQDPKSYDLKDADGVASVMVSENNDLTNALNVCFSVVFNFRGYDTMGESFILIAALCGSLVILRDPKHKNKKLPKDTAIAEKAACNIDETKKKEKNSDYDELTCEHKNGIQSIVVRYAANLLLPLSCVFGGYVVLHGDSSPGGGFQGGVLIASAVLLVFLAYGGQKIGSEFHQGFLHSSETVAEIMYIVVGLLGIFGGLDFAYNFVISSLHIETAVIMNDAVGYHVMAGIGCLLIMMLGMLTASDRSDPNPDMNEPAGSDDEEDDD